MTSAYKEENPIRAVGKRSGRLPTVIVEQASQNRTPTNRAFLWTRKHRDRSALLHALVKYTASSGLRFNGLLVCFQAA